MEETVRLVPSFVTVTLAFAIAAPVGSVTVPVNWAFCTCANALKVRASTANTARQNCNLFIYLPPQKLWRVDLKYARKFLLRNLVVNLCCQLSSRSELLQ